MLSAHSLLLDRGRPNIQQMDACNVATKKYGFNFALVMWHFSPQFKLNRPQIPLPV